MRSGCVRWQADAGLLGIQRGMMRERWIVQRLALLVIRARLNWSWALGDPSFVEWH